VRRQLVHDDLWQWDRAGSVLLVLHWSENGQAVLIRRDQLPVNRNHSSHPIDPVVSESAGLRNPHTRPRPEDDQRPVAIWDRINQLHNCLDGQGVNLWPVNLWATHLPTWSHGNTPISDRCRENCGDPGVDHFNGRRCKRLPLTVAIRKSLDQPLDIRRSD
jgi:hypothetical protein